MRCVFIIYSFIFSVGAYAEPLDSLRAEQRSEGLFVIHRVEDQETIYSIAKRYGSTVQEIIKYNQIVDNRIEIGQVLEVIVIEETKKGVVSAPSPKTTTSEGYHLVEQGETLYSISKKYDVKVKDLKKWNDLDSNYLSPGMTLSLKKDAKIPSPDSKVQKDKNQETSIEKMEPKEDSSASVVMATDPLEDFERYLVQTGETLYTIANKIGVSLDSLRIWNGLRSDYLKIGQQLLFKEEEATATSNRSMVESRAPKNTRMDEKGFEKIYQEGVAAVIESMNTSRFLALHRSLPIGTNLEVRNLMNNQVVHVKVVGKLPDTGLNANLLLRLSQPAYSQLGILDSKSRVEVSYFK